MKRKPKYLKTWATILISFAFSFGVAKGFMISTEESFKIAMSITLITGIIAVNKFRKKRKRRNSPYLYYYER